MTVELSPTGTWTWFQNPQGVYANGRTFFTWSYLGAWVGSYDHATDTIETHRLLETPQNDHNVVAIGIRPDGRILAAYSPHNGPMDVAVSVEPYDVSAWGEPLRLETEYATYPNLYYLAEEETWHLIYRQGPPGAWPTRWRTSTDDGETWSGQATLFQNGGQRPYMQVVGNGVDRLNLSLTDGHPGINPTNSIYHLQYDAGVWRDSAGADLGSPPFEPADVTRVYNGASATGRGWCSDIAIDAAGRPVMVFASFLSETDHRYHYARYDGAAWQVEELTAAGRNIYELAGEPHYFAGICLNHDDTSIVYLCREVETDRWELERWTSAAGAWQVEPITEDSPTAPYKNFRPYYPRGGSPFEVIWAAGSYTSYITYTGGVKALLQETPPPTNNERRRGSSVVGIF